MRSSKKKSNSRKVAERDLCRPIRRFLGGEGCSRIIRELRFFDRSIDLYGVAWGEQPKTIAVELKLRNWQKALQQAALYQLCSDYSYVAMPKKIAHTLEHATFSAAGIGILAVDTEANDVQIVLPAVLSRQANGRYIEPYRELLRK